MVRSKILPLLLAMLASTAFLARPVSAQVTDADLVRENERLRSEVRDLEAALEAALQRIASLEAEVTALRAGGSAAGHTATPAPPEPPAASPEGMIASIKEAFAAAVADEEIPEFGAVDDDASRTRRLRALRKWTVATSRSFKVPVEWPVLVLDSTVLPPSDGMIRVQVWNPETATVVGDAFEVPVSRRIVERVNRPRSSDAEGPAVFLLSGVFMPEIRVSVRRTDGRDGLAARCEGRRPVVGARGDRGRRRRLSRHGSG